MHVVLVPGYLAPPALFLPLLRHLRSAGHQPTVFRYAAHRDRIETHAAALTELTLRVPADEPLAFVAHSLGGLVVHSVLRELERPVDRAVFIAVPHRGCRVARIARRAPLGRVLRGAGRSAAHGTPHYGEADRVGVIVGTRDLTVRPSEAEWDGADDVARLPFGHNELLLRRRTARVIERFLHHGAFDPPLDAAFWRGDPQRR